MARADPLDHGYAQRDEVLAQDRALSTGSLSVSAAGEIGAFFHGDQRGLSPLGDGVLCVAGRIVRGNPVNADAARWLNLAIDNTAPVGYGTAPGLTRYFQAWYRDLSGPSGFNLSDGLWAVFTP